MPMQASAQGVYTGFFEIPGGSDPSSQDILGTVSYSVGVAPEPSTCLLLSTGVALGIITLIRRRTLLTNTFHN
jgi:hypothetical protein